VTPKTRTRIAKSVETDPMRHRCTILVLAVVGSACRPNPTLESPETADPQLASPPSTTVRKPGSDNVTRVAAGEANTCVIRQGGEIWCWGSYDAKVEGDSDPVSRVQRPHRISGMPPAREIAMSDDACAIALDGEVYCGWLHGQPQTIVGASGATALVMAPLQACAVLADGDVVCWQSPHSTSGYGARDRVEEWTPAVRVVGLSSAHEFGASVGDLCIITADRAAVRCQSPFAPALTWGLERPRFDAIAASIEEVCVAAGSEILCTKIWRTAGKPDPRPTPGIGHVVQLGVNGWSLCGRNAEGQVFCYEGKRRAPQSYLERLSDANRVASFRMIDVPPSADLSVGGAHACSVSTAGDVHCWGAGPGVSGEPSAYIPPTRLQLQRFDELDLKGDQTCAIVDGRVFCVNKGRDCPTGRFEERSASAWSGRGDLGKWTHLHVTGSYYASCIASRRERPARSSEAKRSTTTGAERADLLTCLGTSSKREILLRLPNGTWDRTAQLVIDVDFGCIRTHDGAVECFELPALEERHISPVHPAVALDLDPPAVPLVPVVMQRPAAALTVGHDVLCTTSRAGEVHCWRGPAEPQPGPPRTRGASEFAKGDALECQIDGRGDVACRYGERELEAIVGIQRARSLVAGEDHACALDQLGRVYCWGRDERHVLREVRDPGNAREAWKVASLVDLPGEARELFGGRHQTCARLVRGAVMCWGANFGGGLGVGISGCIERPIRVRLEAQPGTANPRRDRNGAPR